MSFTVGQRVKATFATMNKNNTLLEYKEECNKPETETYTQEGDDYYPSWSGEIKNWYSQNCEIEKICILEDKEFYDITNSLLEDREMFKGLGGSKYTGNIENFDISRIWYDEKLAEEYKNNHVTLITLLQNKKTKETIAIDPQGYSYARYVGINIKEL